MSAGVLFATPSALAWQSAYGGGYSWTYDSNITASGSDPVPEWREILFAGMAFEEHESDFDGNLLAQGELRNYVRNTYSDDKSLYLNGSAVWKVAPRVLDWRIEELYREALFDITQPDTPDNRAKSSTFSTGPDVTVRFNSSNYAQIGGRYSRYDIRGPGDNQRRSMSSRLTHEFTDLTNISMNYEAADILYADPVTYPLVLREDWYGRLERRSMSNRATLDVGKTRVTRYGGEPLNGRLLRFEGLRRLTSESSIRASYEEQYSDTFSDSLRYIVSASVPGGAVLIPTGSDAAAGAPYFGKRGDLAYANGDPSTSIAFGGRVYARDVDYLIDSPDYREFGGRLDGEWRPAGDFRFNAIGVYNKRRFQDTDQTDVDRYAALALIYKISRTLSLTFEGSRISRSSNGPQGSYVDLRGMVQLGYSSGPQYIPFSRR